MNGVIFSVTFLPSTNYEPIVFWALRSFSFSFIKFSAVPFGHGWNFCQILWAASSQKGPVQHFP